MAAACKFPQEGESFAEVSILMEKRPEERFSPVWTLH